MSFSDPFGSSLSSGHYPSSLDHAVAGGEFVHSHAGYAHGAAAPYNPDPGSPAFPQSNYQPYDPEPLVFAASPIRAPLPSEPVPEPERLPDYQTTLAATEEMRQALAGMTFEGPVDPVWSEYLRYWGVSPACGATEPPGEVMRPVPPESPLSQPSDRAIQEIEAAIDYAIFPLTPEYPPFMDEMGL